MRHAALRRTAAAHGATLFAIGMFTGIAAGLALTGKLKVGIPHMTLAAHLNGLLGGFWMLALSFSLPMVRYGEVGARRLVRLTLVPVYANWAITLVASFLGVRGLELTGERANDGVAVLLIGAVVLPSLAAASAWAYGLWGPDPKPERAS